MMETLNFQMREAVLATANYDQRLARRKIHTFLKIAYNTLPNDEMEEFLRDIVVLKNDIEQLQPIS